jgi:RNA polymerase sigma factor (sigma-70 family)
VASNNPIVRPAGLRELLPDLGRQDDPPSADGELLTRYVTRRDESAFTALIERYAPMVFGVCRRVLQHPQDAEDAAQATFLVLARRANTLDGRGPLGNWLYTVAYRTALKARQAISRRRAHETLTPDLCTVPASEVKAQSDLRPLLDEELNELPEKYRAPLVLCFLEGKSHRQAAQDLGWSSGSMARRMNRARELLRRRLARRGVEVSAGVLLVLLTKNALAASMSPTLVASTTKAALAFASGQASVSATVSAEVAALAENVLSTTKLAGGVKAGSVLLTVVLLAVIGTMTGLLTHQVRALQQQAAGACEIPVKSEPRK